MDSKLGQRALAKFVIRVSSSHMPTRNISLTAEQDAFVDEVVRSGDYQNASEAIRDALRVLRQRRREDALKLRVLRAQLRIGIEALQRGDADEVEDADLDGYLTSLTDRPAAASAARIDSTWPRFASRVPRGPISSRSSRSVSSGGARRTRIATAHC